MISKIFLENINIESIGVEDINIFLKPYMGLTYNADVSVNKYPELSDKIDLKVEYNKNTKFPMLHIGLDSSIRMRGLGYKIYKAFINEYGILTTSKYKWSGEGTKYIWKKLKKDPELEFLSSKDNVVYMVVKKNFQNKNKYIDKFKEFFQ